MHDWEAPLPAAIKQPMAMAGQAATAKAHILVHVTHEPEQPTRAALVEARGRPASGLPDRQQPERRSAFAAVVDQPSAVR